MMFPTLSARPTSTDMIEVFGGYNHNHRIADSEFYDENNMTSEHYPLMSPRKERGKLKLYDNGLDKHNIVGMLSKEGLCYVEAINNNIYLFENGYKRDLGLTDIPDDTERILVSMGAYIVIFPDKKYFNTEKESDFGDIEASFSVSNLEGEISGATFSLCALDGKEYTYSSAKPSQPKDQEYWLDTSTSPASLKQWSESSSQWIGIASTYIRISAPNIAQNFSEGDGVYISGITNNALSEYNNKTSVIQKLEKTENGAGDYIVIIGVIGNVYYDSISLKRRVPLLDFVIESGNRLWGCRYGLNLNGDVVNELYASKLGDFKNWEVFSGISTDSYVASLGSDGVFTGAISYLGMPLFFKESYIHQVYGYYPAQYQIQTTEARGVQQGSSKSLAMVNETLYYKANNAVCAYNGSLPVEISSVLGGVHYKNAAAEAAGNKYCIAMETNTNKRSLFIYDTQKGVWHKEDGEGLTELCFAKEELYLRDGNNVYTANGTGEKYENKVEWHVESGNMGLSANEKKKIKRINLRFSADVGSRIRIFVEYNSSGKWEQVFANDGSTLNSYYVPIKPKRCDHFRIKIEGKGNVKLYSLSKVIEYGSDK